MDITAGAMTPLLEKLGRLLIEEYNLEKRVKKGVKSLLTELEMMHAVLRKVSEVPPDQLDDQVRIWAGKVRDLSYNMEDAVDTFIVRVEDDDGHERGPNNLKNRVKKLLKKTTKLFSKGKALHQISDAIDEARELADELGDLRQKYMLDAHANSKGDAIDPRLKAVHKDVAELVGIEHTREELITKLLSDGDEHFGQSKQQLKTLSIVGFGGLGKTTLAKAVYDKIKGQFDCAAFVSVSRSPDMIRIYKKVLYELDQSKYASINEAARDEQQLINELKMFLQNKRYLVVIDDIWDEEAWGFIKCVFSNNNLSSRVMTTTRIGSVSKACCSSSDDIIYPMKPLTEDDSKKLFYKRIFPQGGGCPHEFEQVSRNILKKCGGVPLAIITVASLLASSDQQIKPKYQWDNLLNSIGRGLAEGGSVKDMQRILSFSYYDLPSHLKTCLLYLSIFPEDFEIMKDRLIWRWIAEGFVQGGKQETRLYELGESYFNELANRNLIQPVYDLYGHEVVACRVHDMVLDLICSMSSEENFVTILDGTQQSKHNLHSKVRRLSFQNSMSELTTHWVDVTSMSQLRSVTLFRTDVDLMQTALSCFQVLRVLDLEGCNFGKCGHKIDLKPIENLLHLRYLGLRDTCVGVLPVEIGKLNFLETLDLRSGSKEPLVVPSRVVHLKHLMCLHLYWKNTKIPTGMGNLASLEEVTGLWVDGSSAIEKELGQLLELRVLEIYLDGDDESVCSSLVVSLGNLQKLQSLTIDNLGNNARFDVCCNSLVPPPYLRSIVFYECTSTLPTWINSASLPLLSSLRLRVDRVCLEVDFQILGKLPALCYLHLWTTKDQCTRVERCIVGADAFPCLRVCHFYRFQTGPSMFPQGAMPRLEHLEFCARASHIASGELDVSMEHLPSLQRVDVILWREKAAGGTSNECEEADAAVRLAADAHPNRPTLGFSHFTSA
ncbi:putative disease resistance RPP13-like protein 3 isoform X2 [Brachypodium distachyon]|uniref:putative disease resistance RPP13-like protein 3 isoform X2 n=1 Tax=Brachypodium distachyon TaxID=15368 RepID=UPI0006E4872D|nr:putative disease resistance RPP13-like protein 3 isoform X2 [Brachypodium distachyon]|eukprot:XP_014754593.1 putative disease resistance RPP13-like protein 3 isoform X2 [Brachypodium distachyon]